MGTTSYRPQFSSLKEAGDWPTFWTPPFPMQPRKKERHFIQKEPGRKRTTVIIVPRVAPPHGQWAVISLELRNGLP
jgi:hypothetical protein